MNESPWLDDTGARHYRQVARAIEFIRAQAAAQPSLAEIAQAVGMSEHHFQRVFAQWAGVSPKRFLQYLTKEHAKQALRRSADVLGAALDAGLSGPGRLHELMVHCEAMTPGEVRALGAGVTLAAGWADTPFGAALLGWTPRGLCHLAFCDEDEHEARWRELQTHWPRATLVRDDAGAAAWAARVFPAAIATAQPLHLLLRGSAFQLKVWEALLRTEPGQVLSYRQLAALAGVPKAPRAVGSALAANTLGYLIPCHRVIRETAELGQYRWGLPRKAALQAWEAARAPQAEAG